jgi:cobalt/nickel transport system permease protein
MTDWLFKKDNYIPVKEKDAHINKSILSILGILSKIKQDDRSDLGGIYRLSPVLKFIFTILSIVLLILSRNIFYILLIDSYTLFLISLLKLNDIKKILLTVFIAFCFSTIILFPSMLTGNIFNSLLIIFKMIGCVMSINILVSSTKWRHITNSLRVFFVPHVLILILDMTIKYIFILGNFSLNMLYALKLRTVGKIKNKHTSISNLAGVLFLKSKEMSEETYLAMECRGFTGEYRSRTILRIRIPDIFYALISIFFIILFFYINRIIK